MKSAEMFNFIIKNDASQNPFMRVEPSGIKISMIEDNDSIRKNVSKFIGFHEEFDVQEVFQSAEAFFYELDRNSQFEADVLLLDIGLPGMSGVDAIPHILNRLPNINIIMLTTYEEEEVILKAICSGACSYLSKKAELAQIVDAIRIVVKGGSYMSPSIAREIVQHLMHGSIKPRTFDLTDRQEEILKLLVKGKSYQAIGDALHISVETVRTHVKNLYRSLHVNNKAEAIAKYLNGH